MPPRGVSGVLPGPRGPRPHPSSDPGSGGVGGEPRPTQKKAGIAIAAGTPRNQSTMSKSIAAPGMRRTLRGSRPQVHRFGPCSQSWTHVHDRRGSSRNSDAVRAKIGIEIRLAQQTAGPAVRLDLGSHDGLDGTIGFDGMRSRRARCRNYRFQPCAGLCRSYRNGDDWVTPTAAGRRQAHDCFRGAGPSDTPPSPLAQCHALDRQRHPSRAIAFAAGRAPHWRQAPAACIGSASLSHAFSRAPLFAESGRSCPDAKLLAANPPELSRRAVPVGRERPAEAA